MTEGPITAAHNAALPFTRFITGHGDYTPIGYSNPGPTTWAHQLATTIVFTSPLQVIGEHPEMLLRDAATRPALGFLGQKTRRVNGDNSSWTIPAESLVWIVERPNVWKLRSYAGWCTGAKLSPAWTPGNWRRPKMDWKPQRQSLMRLKNTTIWW